jgi:hypothetical protein
MLDLRHVARRRERGQASVGSSEASSSCTLRGAAALHNAGHERLPGRRLPDDPGRRLDLPRGPARSAGMDHGPPLGRRLPLSRKPAPQGRRCEAAATAWIDAELPAPNIVTVNPANGHAHYTYQLASWVRIDRIKAVRFFGAIRKAYTAALRADPSTTVLLIT